MNSFQTDGQTLRVHHQLQFSTEYNVWFLAMGILDRTYDVICIYANTRLLARIRKYIQRTEIKGRKEDTETNDGFTFECWKELMISLIKHIPSFHFLTNQLKEERVA